MKVQYEVSVFMITLNEITHLRRLLPQLSDFREVIIVDSGSTDGTVEFAACFPNVRVSHRDWTGFGDQKAHALSLCRGEWVLNLDADEELTPDYLDVMADTVASNQADALESSRLLLQWGRRPRGMHAPDRLIRLFRKTCGHYDHVKVHERIHINGRIARTDALILHHENLRFSQRIGKTIHYAELKGADKHASGARVGLPVLLLIFPLKFVQAYVFKAYFLDGVHGLLTSVNKALYAFMKYAALWELNTQAGLLDDSGGRPGADTGRSEPD